MLPTAALDYHLPPDLIATAPVSPRDAARLMVVSRSNPDRIDHLHIRDLPALLSPNDLLILNATRVMPARFKGIREDTKGQVEGLIISPPLPNQPSSSPTALLKMRRAKPGIRIRLFNRSSEPTPFSLELLDRAADEGWHIRAHSDNPALPPSSFLNHVGLTPIPPYILAARKAHNEHIDDAIDAAEYQTVFAHDPSRSDPIDLHGSVAAPTAGLHFTTSLLAALDARNIRRAEVMLDVGLGTFKPVESEFIDQHPMHAEFCCIPPETVAAINQLKHSGTGVSPVLGSTTSGTGVSPVLGSTTSGTGVSPVLGSTTSGTGVSPVQSSSPPTRPSTLGPRPFLIAIGTTAARTLESFPTPHDLTLAPHGRSTRLLITPGHHFAHVDALLTNFHLPKTTLLALVAAMLHQPRNTHQHTTNNTDPTPAVQRLLNLYQIAINLRYRFYSYGDAMLILP